MDAISFVLGIKSSHLRSSHLRDLVYRGRVLRTARINADGTATDAGLEAATNGLTIQTNGIKSNGVTTSNADAVDEEIENGSQRHDPQTAWVMAVYEDDAADEQKWKRSITAAGHSEYWINNRVVSARRYIDALETENILIKARNFLVFQGDVEAIASQSPKDLTRLVEQISGSVEYKNDYDRLKTDSEKALEEQTFRLNQRRGMNFEIKQYQEQKKEADNYSRKVDERDQAIITHVLWKLFHFQRVIDESEAEIQKHQEELKEYKRGVEKFERKLDESRKDQARVGRDVSQIERTIKKKVKETEEKENGLVPVDEKIAISQKNFEKYQTRIADVTKEANGQKKNLDQLKKELATVQKAHSRWESEWQKAAQMEGKQLSEADLQQYTKLKSEVTKRSAAAQGSADQTARQLRTEAETVNSLKSKVEAADDQMKRLKEEIQVIMDRETKLKATVKEIVKDVEDKKKNFHTLTSERLRTAQKQTELEEKLQDVLNKLIEGENGRRQSEKEIRARETLVAMKRIFPGVRGRVVELCKPKQKKYETAVSTIFGRHHDSIVVETEKVAKECIQYLRDQRLGQATFIPLDSIQVKAANSNLRGIHKGMRLATDVIEYDNSVERAMSYVCGNSVVCDDLSVAKYICYQKDIGVKAVTVDGTIIHKGGLMTGGRGPNDRNERRWEEAELEALRQMKDKFLADIAALPKGHRRGAEEEALQGELAGLEQQLSYVKGELKSLERNVQSKSKELDFIESQLAEARPKYQEQLSRLQSLQQKFDGYQAEIGKVEDKIFGTFCQRLGYRDIRDYEAQQGGLQQEAAQRKLEFTTQRSKLENQVSFEAQRLQATQDRIKSLNEQAKRDEQLIGSLKEEKEAVEEELETHKAELEDLHGQLEDLKTRYAEKSERVAEQRREMQKRSKNVEGSLKAVTDLEEIVQKQAAGRYAQLRKCKIDEIKIPLTSDSEGLDALPLDDMLGADPNAMDVDEQPDSSTLRTGAVQDYGIAPDYEELDSDLKEVSHHQRFLVERILRWLILKCENHRTIPAFAKSLYLTKSAVSPPNWKVWHRTCVPWKGSKPFKRGYEHAKKNLTRQRRLQSEQRKNSKPSRKSDLTYSIKRSLTSRIKSITFIKN